MTAAPSRHILLTGFEPFDGDAVNPSGEVAKRLDGRAIGDAVVRSAILSVQHEAARAVVTPLLDAAKVRSLARRERCVVLLTVEGRFMKVSPAADHLPAKCRP